MKSPILLLKRGKLVLAVLLLVLALRRQQRGTSSHLGGLLIYDGFPSLSPVAGDARVLSVSCFLSPSGLVWFCVYRDVVLFQNSGLPVVFRLIYSPLMFLWSLVIGIFVI